MTLPPDHPPIPKPKVGVLLMNLGTPDGPDAKSVKRYLGEFLSDSRVVEIPQIAWQPILRGIILNTRPKKSAHAYSQVWREDGSPLAAITRLQAAALKDSFGPEVLVDWAMRYGNPSISDRLTATNAKGFMHLAGLRWRPPIRTLPPYYDDTLYIDALKDSLEEGLSALDFTPDAIVASFHGMPKRTLQQGDPYHCHCQKTARLLGERMGRELTIAFQSRFGPQKWLGPATDETLVALAKAGKTKVAIFAPGFSADCLETLEELSIRGRESFEEAGGTHFAYLPCLNDSPVGVEMLRSILARELEGWVRAG
jgi:ferrochelatase